MLTIGTRGSPLALRQTEIVKDLLEGKGFGSTIKIIKTSGDMFIDRPLHQLSGQGVFVREIDERMLAGEVDLAVHSMKDLPTKRPDEIVISAVIKRDSPHDILLTRDGSTLEDLKPGDIVGTSSMRRAAQLRRARPDLAVRNIRGNLQTRLRKLNEEKYDAIILAEAGIERMGYHLDYHVLDPEIFVPSANQGTIVVVSLVNTDAYQKARQIDHEPTRIETLAERRIMEIVGGGCVVPVAVHAKTRKSEMRVIAEVLSLDGKRFVRVDEVVPVDDLKLCEELGFKLVNMGGRELVEEAVRSGSR